MVFGLSHTHTLWVMNIFSFQAVFEETSEVFWIISRIDRRISPHFFIFGEIGTVPSHPIRAFNPNAPLGKNYIRWSMVEARSRCCVESRKCDIHNRKKHAIVLFVKDEAPLFSWGSLGREKNVRYAKIVITITIVVVGEGQNKITRRPNFIILDGLFQSWLLGCSHPAEDLEDKERKLALDTLQ